MDKFERNYINGEWVSPSSTATLQVHNPSTREFIATVNYRAQVAALPPELQASFLDRITEMAAAQPEPFLLDYWRLNVTATRPT